MCEIVNIDAIQILDSRGIPTIEAQVYLSDGTFASASIPSGKSKGLYEAHELRDGIFKDYMGKGVFKAIDNIKTKIAPCLIGEKIFNQRMLDNLMLELDGTFNKSNLGANAILSVSLACARAAAKSLNIPLYKYLGGLNGITLPTPMMNILNGGVHADNNLDFQEFMISPTGFASFDEAVKAGVEIYHTLEKILKDKSLSTAVGDEGGFAPEISTPEEALDLILQAIELAGYSAKNVKICIDVAASEFYLEGECQDGVCSLSHYYLKGLNKKLSTEQMITYLENLVANYPIISIEDGLAQDDFLGWKELTSRLKNKCQLVGDDLFATNISRLTEGIQNNIANSILVKPNQIGTLTESLDTILFAKEHEYNVIISHRSGETEDTFISDLAVAINSGLIKIGALARGERTAKYNRLLYIEDELGLTSKYLGINAYKNIDIEPSC